MSPDPGMHARVDMAFKALLAVLTCWTKEGKIAWKKGGACTSLNLQAQLGEFEKELLSLGEDEAKGPIEVMIDFAEYRAHTPVPKVKRFEFGVVIGHAWQIVNIRSDRRNYDLFTRLFRAAYDSVMKTNPDSLYNFEKMDWNDILGRKWKISKKEIQKLAEEGVRDKRRDYEEVLRKNTIDLQHSFEGDGFEITE